MKNTIRLLSAIITVILALYTAVSAQTADTFYVDFATGTDALTSGAVLSPAKTLGYTVDTLVDDSLTRPVVILMAPGTYQEPLTYPDAGAHLSLDPIVTDSVNTFTIQALDFSNPPVIEVDTLRGSLMRMDINYSTLDHIHFLCSGDPDHYNSGGLRITADHVTIRNCVFSRSTVFNNFEYFSRAISIGGNYIHISNNVFFSPGIYAILLEITPARNTGYLVENNVFIQQEVHRAFTVWPYNDIGVAFYTTTPNTRLRNSMVANNVFFGQGAGIYWQGGTNLTIEPNTVVYNMFSQCGKIISAAGDPSYTTRLQMDSVNVNFKTDPMFKDTTDAGSRADVDLYLRVNSPAIDRGNPRIMDPDGSRSDIGVYGGPWADTLAPHQLDTLTVLGNTVSGKDTLIWEYGTVPGDFDMYAIYRDASGPGFVPSATNIIDSISNSGTTQTIYDNGGIGYFYKVNVWDTDTLGGGYKMFDTIPPYIGSDSVIFLSNGTVTPVDDTMIILLSEPVIDPFSFGVPADSFFRFVGLGDLAGCSLSTGAFPNDDTVLIYGFDAGINIPCHERSWLEFTDPSVWTDYALNEGTQAGSVKVVTYNVGLKSNGAQYGNITDAINGSVPLDSVFIIDAGWYEEAIVMSQDSLYLCGYGFKTGAPWITGDSLPVITNPVGADTMVYISNDAFVFGIKFLERSGTPYQPMVAKVTNGAAQSFLRCVFDKNGNSGRGWSDPSSGPFVIDSCDFSNFNHNVVYSRITGYSQRIINSRFHDMDVSPPSTGDAALFYYGAGYHTVKQYIQNNIFYNIAGGAAIELRQSQYVQVAGNLIYNSMRGISWNYATNENRRNFIAFNTVIQCTTQGISINTEPGYEDTVIGNISWGNGGSDFTCRRADSMAYADYNWSTGGNNSSTWTSGAHSDSGYPLFVDTTALDFRLQPASLCLNFTDFNTSDAVAIGLDTVDMLGTRRANPFASYWDAGALEGGGGPPRIDSVNYWSCGTDSVGDDSLVVYFRRIPNENTTVPTGAGMADSMFVLEGKGSFGNAVVAIPGGGDTNLVVIRMDNADTVLSHNRIRLRMLPGLILSALDSTPAIADTETVTTYNVYNMRTDAAYRTMHDANEDAVLNHGDTVKVCDEGFYTDTLRIERDVIFRNAAGLRPVIKYNGSTTSSVLGNGVRSGYQVISYGPEFSFYGFEFDGSNLNGVDSIRNLAGTQNGTFRNCIFHSSSEVLLCGSGGTDSLIIDSCEFYNAANNQLGPVKWERSSPGRISNSLFHDNGGYGLCMYPGGSCVIVNNRIYDNTYAGIFLRGADANRVYNNIIYDNGGSGIAVYTSLASYMSKYNRFIGNTVYNNAGGGVMLDSMGLAANNVCYGNGGWQLRKAAGVGTAQIRADSIRYNLADSTGSRLGDSLTSANGNAVGNEDPRFAVPGTDFHLLVHSAAIDRGDTAAAWRDFDGSRCDAGAYGGPFAIDTLNPHRLDTLRAFSSSSLGYAADTVWWDAYTLPDFKFYAIHRGDDGDFVPSETNCIDSIYTVGTLGARYQNDGGAYVYKISAVDSTDYGSGYQSATYPRVFTAKTTHQIHTVPGDTLIYAIYYDNDGELPTTDTVTFVDKLPGNVTFIDTAGITVHTGGSVDVDWYTGTWQETKPVDPTTVTAIRWQVVAPIAPHEDGGDAPGADNGKTGIDTTGGDDAGAVYFRVLVK